MASKEGPFCLPVAKDAARACPSLKKLGLHLFFMLLTSFIAHELGPVVSLAEGREGHVPVVCGKDCANFIAWKSVWIRLVLGRQQSFDYLTE